MNKKKKEGELSKQIEERTAEIPSDVYLWTAVTAMGVSLTLKCFKQDNMALFVGQWAAPFMLMGVYNKIVKTEGSD